MLRVDDDDDVSWLYPPVGPADVPAWDHYWSEQVRHGLGPSIFDMCSDDRNLVHVMNIEGMRNILCAGNGISQEPRALAHAGFQVLALDTSPQATELAQRFEFIKGCFEFFCNADMERAGGNLNFVVGDILDPAICPGPFDVIIERRTAQIFPSDNRGAVLSALAARLGPNGIFLSHSHDGGWKPPAEPRHFTEAWFRKNQWVIPKSGVKFAVFERICPKIGVCAKKVMQQSWIFIQSNFSPRAVLCYELDAVSSLSRLR